MRDRIIIIAGVLFIAACALVTFARISSHYSAPGAPAQLPASWTPPPLVPETTSAAAAASPRPRRTVTAWVTVTAHPSAGGDGR